MSNRKKSCFSSFHSLSYSSTVRWIELGIELGIDLRINNARLTVLARVSGLVYVRDKKVAKQTFALNDILYLLELENGSFIQSQAAVDAKGLLLLRLL